MPTQQTAFRLPLELLARIDRHAERLSRSSGNHVTRADVVRALLAKALHEIERPRKAITPRGDSDAIATAAHMRSRGKTAPE